MKFYAVRKGRIPGIYESWSSCQSQVEGYRGAEFKSFHTRAEAEDYLKGDNKNDTRKVSSIRDYDVIAYVDGSYDKDKKTYSSGVVILDPDFEVMSMKSFSGNEVEYVSMRNVAGEILAASYVLRYAIQNKLKKIAIFYDYEGIEKWCTGEWSTRKMNTHQYRILYLEARTNGICIDFQKIKSHSKDFWNDIADGLAKLALNMVRYEDILYQIINHIYDQSSSDQEFLDAINHKLGNFIEDTTINEDGFIMRMANSNENIYFRKST